MLCRVCKEEKLSKEFVFQNLNEDCDHPELFCMKCAVKAKEFGKCPYPSCSLSFDVKQDALQDYLYTLESMYPDMSKYETVESLDPVVNVSLSNDMLISVVMLTGERLIFNIPPNTTVLQLKRQIFTKQNIMVEKQKLIFEEKELETYATDGFTSPKLSVFGVKNNSVLCLMVVLYEIPENFNHVVFDLNWGYPHRKRDYLDASCLVFSGINHINTVDYDHRYNGLGILHSGDVMNDAARTGHHTINVDLKNIPSYVSHLFFTLSAWNSPTIAHFPNPSLKFFEASNKNKDLCNTSFTHARHSEAIIMCSVSQKHGKWQIFRSGKLSTGCARNYNPILATIQQLILSGKC